MAKNKPTSFISEHTAEYFLVPAALQVFSETGEQVLPLYFWATREGSRISRECGSGEEEVRLVAVYPRRPKVIQPNQDHVYVKFNLSLFETAKFAQTLDVPVFAGVPLASSILDLSPKTLVAWFHLEPKEKPIRDEVVRVALHGKDEDTDSSSMVKRIGEEELLDLALNRSRTQDWDACLNQMKEVRRYVRVSNYGSRWPWFGGYKPFFIVIVENNSVN